MCMVTAMNSNRVHRHNPFLMLQVGGTVHETRMWTNDADGSNREDLA